MDFTIARFSVVRLVADSLRQTTVPIGVVAERANQVAFRFIGEITPPLRALAHPRDREASLRFGLRFQELLQQLPKDGTVLAQLSYAEWGGFIFDRPRQFQPQGTLEDDVGYLYREYVAPRAWRPVIKRRSRLSTTVRRHLKSFLETSPTALPLQVGVEFTTPGLEVFDFDAALANGHLTLVKAVDLSVQQDRQRLHTNEALAESAIVKQLVDSDQVQSIAIANPSAALYDAEPFLAALRTLCAKVFLFPEEADLLEEYVRVNAQDDVGEKAAQLGMLTTRDDDVLRLVPHINQVAEIGLDLRSEDDSI